MDQQQQQYGAQYSTLAMKPLLSLPTMESLTISCGTCSVGDDIISPGLLSPPLQNADSENNCLLCFNLVN